MSIVNVDSEELRRIATILDDANKKIEEYIVFLRSAQGQLESGWRDTYYHKFAENFEQTLRQAALFSEVISPLISMVRDKAERVDEYCSVKMESIEL